MPTEAPPGPDDDPSRDAESAGAGTYAAGATADTRAATARRARTRATGVGRFRQRPPAWTALLTGVFAIGVFAATDGVLRLLAEPTPASAPGGASPGRAPTTAAQAPGEAPPSGTTPAPATPAPGSSPAPGPTPAPATQDGAANDSASEDTNVDEAAEGPRRAAPAKPSEDEAPEFRESADNNISLPVDI